MTSKKYTKGSKTLYIAFELASKKWRLCLSDGSNFYQREIDAEDLMQLSEKIDEAIKKFKLSSKVKIVSCYEAGRDGFWIHRFLENCGIKNLVVDPASIETNRRKRRAKTDRIDARKLCNMLIRHFQGETGMWSICNVPTIEAEDGRQVHRELGRLKKDRARSKNRISSVLKIHGIEIKIRKTFLTELEDAQLWDGRKIPPNLKSSIIREYERLRLVEKQINNVEKERENVLKEVREAREQNKVKGSQKDLEQIVSLMELCGIGHKSAWIFVMEFFSWRKFKNRRQVGALAGLTPTPYDSGDSRVEQGISKSGNRRIRSLAVEVSWFWLRYQPQSKLSRWYNKRFAKGGPRMRKIGIVAMARKLLVDLWKYLEFGEVPQGAKFKKA